MKVLRFMPKFFGWSLVLALAAAAVGIFFVQRVSPLERGEAEALVKPLFEGVQITRPHRKLDEGKTRAANTDLFSRVEQGETLSDEESERYRQLYQGIVGTRDVWQLRNDVHAIADTLEKLRALGTVGAPYERSKYARSAYQALFDLMAPYSRVAHLPRAGAYSPPATPPETRFEQLGETFLKEMKTAQLERVNSHGYFAAIDRAMAAYVDMIVEAQSRIDPRVNWFERKCAGPFAGWQSLTPLFAERTPPRPRKAAAP
jgi:hypothetical protein